MRPHIRDMTSADIDRVGEIFYEAFNKNALKYGYTPQIQSVNEAKSWAWAMLHHGPCIRLVAEVEERVVGAICLNPRGENGGHGPLAIDPCSQGGGVARELMNACFKRTEDLQSTRCIQEAYNPETFYFLYTFNYMPVATLMDLILDKRVEPNADLCSDVAVLSTDDLDELCAYDFPRSKFDRRTDLRYYSRWGKIFVYRSRSQIKGYLACLPGPRGVQLGPLLAEGEEEAKILFKQAVKIFKERSCRTRVMARDSILVRALQGLGFKLYCVDLLMIRGPWRPDKYVEAFGMFPEGV